MGTERLGLDRLGATSHDSEGTRAVVTVIVAGTPVLDQGNARSACVCS
jgi:hypothetical protein